MKVKSKGAISQCENGTWMIDTKVKVDGEFKHFKKTGYPTLSAAKADYERAKAEFISSKSLNKCKVMIFEDLLKEYQKKRKITVNITTLGCDKSIYNVYFLPHFKGKLLKDVFNKDNIVTWYNNLVEDEKVSDNKKSKVVTRMKDLLKFAYEHKYIDAVTYQDCDVEIYQVKISKKPKTERVVWTKEEETAFFNAITDSKDLVMFKVFFACSPRLGEFLGLTPSCFDYEKRKITIQQQAVYIEGKGLVLTEKLKTSDSHRSIIIDKETADTLKEYIDTLGIRDNEYLFFGIDKKAPMGRTTFRRKLDHYCSAAEVRKINPHAVRHLTAVRLASVCRDASDIESCASRLGHTPEMFLNTYAKHVKEEKQDELLNRLKGAF